MHTASQRDQEVMEREANIFAMELLMPEAWLCADLEREPFDITDDDHLARLAKKYGVSKSLMAIRLARLFEV